ncbi:MAG TPA: histidine kinase, partial [Cyclobacteriaceae bacterium]|nr:histidine kinase [Cyclobacteriaceae bacterium]
LIEDRYIIPDTTSNQVAINSVKVLGKEIYPTELSGDSIVLSYDRNSFSIDFAALDFLNSHKIKYSYKLEGLKNNTWTTPSNNNSTEFSHLAGGNYIFKLRVLNHEGIWGKEKNLLYVHVETPFWETTWFYVLIILFFSGSIALVYSYQLNRNKRISQLQLKALHTQMRPHFIFNCLSAINGHIVKFETVKASEFLTQFSKLMRGILENSTESWITLKQEIETLRLYLVMEALRFEDKFSYKIEVEDEVQPSSILIPSMIVQPYVENAIAHGLLHKVNGSGVITVKFLKGNGNLKCIVEDNGIGRERSNQIRSKSKITHKSLGLKITSERLQLLQGSSIANIQDLKNELGEPVGTRIIIVLMMKKVVDEDLVNLH